MAERIVPEARLRPSAAPVDTYVAPALERAPATNGWLQMAEALKTIEPGLQSHLQNKYRDIAARSESEGQLAENNLSADIEFEKGREGWRGLINDVRKQNPEAAEKLVGANPHFRRGVYKARMNRLGMALNDHLFNMWRENPTFEGQNIHDVDDPMVVDKWMSEAVNTFTERYGINGMDPVLVQEVYGRRVNAAKDQLMSRHTEFRNVRYKQEYVDEMSSGIGMTLSSGTGASDIGTFLDKMGASESSNSYSAKNSVEGAGGNGHFGFLQFSRARFNEAKKAGVVPAGMTIEQFATDENAHIQRRAGEWHFADIDAEIRRQGHLSKGYSLDGLRAVAHLGGKGGMNKYVESGGKYNPGDDFGTRLSNYYQKFAGPSQDLQGTLDAAVKDGLSPREANETLVDSVIRTAAEAGNADVMSILSGVNTGHGPLSEIGWVKDKVMAAEQRIQSANWQRQERERILLEREKEARVLELQTEATRSILTDPYADISQLQGAALNMGDPTLATQLGDLQNALINRDQKVYPDHDFVTQLHIGVADGSIESRDLFSRITEGVRDGLMTEADASELIDAANDRESYGGVLNDKQIAAEIRQAGDYIGDIFATENLMGDKIKGTQKSIEAERFLMGLALQWRRENPDGTLAEARDYMRKETDRMLKSPVWKPNLEEQDAIQQRSYGNVSETAQLVRRAVTQAETLSDGEITKLAEIAQNYGMSLQQYIEIASSIYN